MDEHFKERMGSVWPAFKFRMVLDTHIKRFIFQLYGFHQMPVGRRAGYLHAIGLKILSVVIVELITMAVAFRDFRYSVSLFQSAVRRDHTGISSQTHGSALWQIPLLIRHQIDDQMFA